MNNDTEEEIKIEYYESFSSDPLADNCENTKDKIKKTEDDNYTTDFIDENTKDNNMPKCEIINWYKEIDNSGRYLCRYCDLKYSTIQTLRYHIIKKHNEANELRKLIANNKRKHKIKCHICNERFQYLKELKVHFDAHHSTAYLLKSCFYCDATFKCENETTEHQHNAHRIVKKSAFVCSICGYRTSKKSHFDQHKNTHSSIKGMKCNYCDYSTNYLPNLNIHERIHTNTKPYKCDYGSCSYSCAAKSALRSHRLKHFPDENMLYCDKCSYKTVYKQSLKKHQDSHNRNSIGFRIV